MTTQLERPAVPDASLASDETFRLNTTTAMIDEVKRDLRETPRSLKTRTTDDTLCLAGAGIAALMSDWLIYDFILPTRGALGFVVVLVLLFTAYYAALTALSNPRTVVIDRLGATVITVGASITGLALASAVIYTFYRGYPALHHLNFYTQDSEKAGPESPLTQGGIAQAILGSLIEISIAVAITVPLGIGTAIYMSEVGGRISRVVRTVVEAMTALPSIVAGLFIYSTLIVHFHVHRSGFAAAMALTVMMLPIMARATDVVLRVIPGGLRQAGLALGAPTWRVVWTVVLPAARGGLATALILAVARGVGETSPVLLTSGDNDFFQKSPFGAPMESLPLYILGRVRSGQTLAIDRGFGAASVLLALVLILFVIARFLARPKKLR